MMLASTTLDRAFSDRDFRDALGRFATGVAVITGMTDEGAPWRDRQLLQLGVA
jgi:flavin reductase (DIM6/NTAB) family NADH-FMN oxidoreductase RutF